MSILKQPVSKNKNRGVRISEAELRQITINISSDVPKQWERGFRLIWDNPRATPAEMLETLGTDAAEFFELSNNLFAFIQTIMDGRLDSELARLTDLLNLRKPVTIHPDGTVTLDG
jgi:hypothetical protein